MKFKNPSGTEKITIKDGEVTHIQIEDFDSGSRDFCLIVELVGEKAECHIVGRAQSQGDEKKSWTIKQQFKGKNQAGSIDLKGMAQNKSFLEFDGSGTLEKTSIDAEAQISEKIILFDQAKGRSLPVLRVETDKVKSAGHGASIAPINPEIMLYLASRGIDKTQAQEIIKAGFLSF